MANETESKQELNATQLDAQRARHLLDRALGLAERNDLAGAIVTCRQSLALAPSSPQGWSMLGLLHERDGDIDGAIDAYGRALQLSPASTLERESLQRLRQKRGAAPRPVPQFNFDKMSDDLPQVPSVAADQPAIPQSAQIDSLANHASTNVWDVFYFRSLPMLVAAIACLGLILVAQRVAANRQKQNVPSVPVVSTTVKTRPTVPVQPATPAAAPSTPTISDSSSQLGQVDSSQNTESQTNTTPTPVIAPRVTPPVAPKVSATPKPKPKPNPKPKPKPAPRAAPPSEMPVLPRPRLTLPQRPAPAAAKPDHGTPPSPSEPIIDGGPVDVGNSEDGKYIPVSPPQFPNASRN